MSCAILPPDFEPLLRDGSPCPLAVGHGQEHVTTTQDGRCWKWNGFDCAYPENCTYDGDSDCCVSFGEIHPRYGTPL